VPGDWLPRLSGKRPPESRIGAGWSSKELDMAGEADEAKGRIKEAAGDLTGDRDLKNEGKADKVGGKIKGAVDDVKDKLTGKD
jgi:uncharacterized protein YjbJ (UPF0337 family)